MEPKYNKETRQQQNATKAKAPRKSAPSIHIRNKYETRYKPAHCSYSPESLWPERQTDEQFDDDWADARIRYSSRSDFFSAAFLSSKIDMLMEKNETDNNLEILADIGRSIGELQIKHEQLTAREKLIKRNKGNVETLSETGDETNPV